MRYSVVMALILLVACAAQAPLEPRASLAGLAESSPNADQVRALPLDEPDSGRVCKTMKRPGSNIADTVCYTRQEQLAMQEASKEGIDELRREQHWRDQEIQRALMENRYPRGFGLGPR